MGLASFCCLAAKAAEGLEGGNECCLMGWGRKGDQKENLGLFSFSSIKLGVELYLTTSGR